jgi:hypothetical protein
MGLFDRLSGTQKPAPDVVAVGPQELRDRLLRLNNPALAWLVRDGSPEKVDLIAEWKGDDPAWRRIFDAVSVNLTFQVHMRFNPEKTELRVQDRMVDWKLDRDLDSPNRLVETHESGNLKIETTGSVDGTKYSFNTVEIKDAIKQTVTSSGWTHRAVILRKV